ncbi:CidA/LrgA family protein [Ketogulonicigenium vulgare]|uniref:Putative effector of murein hydrolase LrgA n=1 Tax=Ketogulonicigenium vulgare (strain WSH-001) TaxID=759362 RepID=F9Y987_KETVW|nr:CidA/LrgA family protein [Ketogulonicigenium vulgare]ADO41572.1 Putative effector of murein hydrolase LrgA [Ketogulonicigenium vulgare Y25]AEM41304.1 putative effector of murein hydrolase LrgA [Ketogulonicigenium vulgare WSH-001]ALJ81438.1 hydrogenase [Ketogulonicigenium vulgare]ANW34157.1 hydrogenase [Ketogulonicigenium vulgare]AOZ55037.1 effector of murein hydrolase LrgA [Ketogulonicigenium vulgare]
MLKGLFVILACQLVGEIVIRLTGWPLSAPVIGIVLLFALLLIQARRTGDAAVEQSETVKVADRLLSVLGLFFVPGGVGIIVYFDAIAPQLWPMVAALVGSTLITLLVTAAVFAWLSKRGRA